MEEGLFSLGGRLTLVQDCLSSFPIYFLSLFKIPVGVAKRLEKMMRDFLWSGSGESSRDHLVSWEVVCKPNSQGGLGIVNLWSENISLEGKWLW